MSVLRKGLAALVLAASLAAPAVAQQPQTVVYRHASVFDPAAGVMRPDTAIVVTGERIAAVVPDRQLTPEQLKGARVADLTGRFVLPGLIDTHEHQGEDRRAAEANLRRDLYGGVTAIRDMADDVRIVADLARSARLREIPAPDIFYVALMAGPSFFSDPRTNAAAQGAKAGAVPWMQAITPDTDLAEAVTLARGTSATAIKVYANLPGDLVARIVAEAHRQHIPVWAHTAVYPASPREVAASGADVMSHSCSLGHQVTGTPATYQSRVPFDAARFPEQPQPELAAVHAEMLRQGTILDATVWIYAEAERRAKANPKARPALCTGKLAALFARQAWRAGVPISAGTDSIAPWTDPWPSLHSEIRQLVSVVGMPPAQALKAATLTAARAAAQEKDMGSVEPGKLANFVVLAADPTADIGRLSTLQLTVKRGAEYPRARYRPLTKGELGE